MTVGTNLLVRVFEAFSRHGTSQKVFRRLYCESGHPARKAYGFVNDSARKRMDEVIPMCNDKHLRLQTSTNVLILDELARINEFELLREMYFQIGGPAKHASKLCSKRTQYVIQRLERQTL